MIAERIIELRSRKPFFTFVIRLKDGTKISVDEPHCIATGPNSPSCVVHNQGTMRIVAYRDIAEITVPLNEADQEWL
jgi:hypothetical protein